MPGVNGSLETRPVCDFYELPYRHIKRPGIVEQASFFHSLSPHRTHDFCV